MTQTTATAHALKLVVREDEFAPAAPFYVQANVPTLCGSHPFGYARSATKAEAVSAASEMLARELEREASGLLCGIGNYSPEYRAIVDARRLALRATAASARELAG